MNYEKKYMLSLFLFIVLMLIPFIICNIVGNMTLLVPIMAVNFIIALINMLYYFFKITKKFSVLGIILSFIYYLISSLTLISNIFYGITTDLFDIINTLANFTTFFLFFSLPLTLKLDEDDINFFLRIFFYFSLISCFYNILVNISSLENITTLTNSYDVAFQSFFSNRNQYGAFLFISISVLDLLRNTFKSPFKFYISYLFLLINLLLTMSRGAILATLVYIIIYYVLRNKNKLDWFKLTALLSMLILLIKSSYIINIITKYIVRPDNGSTGRSKLWELGSDIFINNNIFTGVGLQTAIGLAKQRGMERDEFHNFYLEVFLSGGILEFLFLIIIFCIIVSLIFLFVNNNDIKSNLISRMIGFFILGLVESVGLFSLGYVDIFFSIFLITLPILYINKEKLRGE